MPVVASNIGPEGALVGVRVSVPSARRAVLERHAMQVPAPVATLGVIDTGSYRSGVDRRILEALELRGEVDVVPLHTPSTRPGAPHQAPVYVVGITLLSPGGDLSFPDVFAFATDFEDAEEARVVIGRELLARCHFQYFGTTRTFQLAW